MTAKKPGSARKPLILTGATAVLSFLLLLYIHSTSRNALEKFVPWVDASTEIKLEIALAHLWLEEVLSGDSHESIEQVRHHIEEATWYASAILDGGKNNHSHILPLTEKSLRSQVNQVLYMIQQFQIAAEERYASPDLAGSGSEPDQNIDQLFHNFMDASTQLESALKLQIAQEHSAQNSFIIMLTLAISAMTVISGYSIWRFTISRGRYLAKLAVANARILEQNAQLKRIAHTDQLTGLPNRKMLEVMTRQAISRVQRNGHALSLTFIDLDFFKPINDEFGHNIGDKVLINFTTTIKHQLREGDLLARLAGDEFILLIQDDTTEKVKQALEHIFSRINQRLADPILDSPSAIHIRCSSGTALAPQDAIDFETLLHYADIAMYESKNKGRGQHCYYRADNPTQHLDTSPSLDELHSAN